jgi:hypothetical protein
MLCVAETAIAIVLDLLRSEAIDLSLGRSRKVPEVDSRLTQSSAFLADVCIENTRSLSLSKLKELVRIEGGGSLQ